MDIVMLAPFLLGFAAAFRGPIRIEVQAEEAEKLKKEAAKANELALKTEQENKALKEKLEKEKEKQDKLRKEQEERALRGEHHRKLLQIFLGLYPFWVAFSEKYAEIPVAPIYMALFLLIGAVVAWTELKYDDTLVDSAAFIVFALSSSPKIFVISSPEAVAMLGRVLLGIIYPTEAKDELFVKEYMGVFVLGCCVGGAVVWWENDFLKEGVVLVYCGRVMMEILSEAKYLAVSKKKND